MTTDLAPRNGTVALPEAIEQALVQGNLTALDAPQRVKLYDGICDSLGLNKLTTPFQYLTLNGKLVLYATRNCTDQLRKIHNVGLTIVGRERQEDVYVVTARATLPNGRTDESIGAVTTGNLKGDALCNAIMKAETKAKRRVTLSIIGLSLLDETEIETVPGAMAHPTVTVHEPEARPEPAEPEMTDEKRQIVDDYVAALDSATEPLDVKRLHTSIKLVWEQLDAGARKEIQAALTRATKRLTAAPETA